MEKQHSARTNAAWYITIISLAVLIVLLGVAIYSVGQLKSVPRGASSTLQTTVSGTATTTVKTGTSSLDGNFPVDQISITSGNYSSSGFVYLAVNNSQQVRGYMNQTNLGDCDSRSPCLGMDFLFSNYSVRCFWMKNTRIPLKQVWVNANGIVIAEFNATPESTSVVCQYGESVLEVSPNMSIPFGAKVDLSSTAG